MLKHEIKNHVKTQNLNLCSTQNYIPRVKTHENKIHVK